MVDIYFEPNYGKLYENIENGKSIVYTFEHEYGKIQHMFIKREIPYLVNDNKYFDIVTPYGYGGPIFLEKTEEKIQELVNLFEDNFEEYCIKNNIVSEFVRFHPVLENHQYYEAMYDIIPIRKTVGTNLEIFEDPFQKEFSKSCRKNTRRALRNGVSYNITEKPDDIKNFLEIYYSTMNRNSAQDFYYFDESYFEKTLKFFKNNILLVEAMYKEKTIAMGFYFVYGDYIHTHLSGTLSKYMKLSPAYVLRYALTQWGKERGYTMIHHGGGTTNDPDDSLYKFKKQFGVHTDFQFYIGKRIWNHDVYNELCKKRNVTGNVEFFPAYRYETSEE